MSAESILILMSSDSVPIVSILLSSELCPSKTILKRESEGPQKFPFKLIVRTESSYEAKLVRCVEGRILDVIVDIRKDSPSYGMVFAVELNPENQRELFVPRGFAHGFIAFGVGTNKIEYLVDKNYCKEDDRGYFFDGKLSSYLLREALFGRDIFPAFDWDWSNQEEDSGIRSEKDKNAKKFHPKIVRIK